MSLATIEDDTAKAIKSPRLLKGGGRCFQEIITVYATIDELLRTICHKKDCRLNKNDVEIITTSTSLTAAIFFNANRQKEGG